MLEASNERGPFPILYEDEWIVAINKPSGILVHRTGISQDTVFVLQLLRDQLGGDKIFVTHRLDRGASGVLVFAKTQEAASRLGIQFMDKTMEKKYWIMVRGWLREPATIDYALADKETGKGLLDAVTHYTPLANSEIDAAIGLRYSTARFSLIEARPETGRRHQIRKHFAHINHPVICDVRHGDVKQNKYFRDVFGFNRLMLHATSIQFQHPFHQIPVRIEAPAGQDFLEGLSLAGLRQYAPVS